MNRIKIGKCASIIGISTISIQLIRNINDTKKDSRDDLFIGKNLKVKDPILLFEKWFEAAKNDSRIIEANAMCLATATKSGLPSARFMFLEEYSRDGFTFFTHYKSRKGQELEDNPNATLIFYWDHFGRSVRIEGGVEKLSCCKSEEYFKQKTYDCQISSHLCDQSTPITDSSLLDKEEKKLKKKYLEGQVPRHPLWGGYIIRPHTMEFWQCHNDRIDRIRFRRLPGGNGWLHERLCP